MDGNMSRQSPSSPLLPPSCLVCSTPLPIWHTSHSPQSQSLPLFHFTSIFTQNCPRCQSGCNACVLVLGRILPEMCPNGVSNGNINHPRPPPTRADQPEIGRPSPTEGEFTRLHHVMLILITILFSSYQAHKNSCLSQNLQPFQEPFMVIAAPGSVKMSKL